MATESPTEQIALYYATKLKWRVFPCHSITDGCCTCGKADCGSPGKHPRTKNGVKDATTDTKQIRAWWKQWPDAHIAIACGSGLAVLDIDPRHGGDESLDQLTDEIGKLPDTPEVLTGGGGRHLYFTCDQDLPNKVSLLPGIDLRSEGGYVVAPKSGHISGRRYEWEASSRPDSMKPAILPTPILRLALGGQGNGLSADQSGKIDPDCVFEGIPEGERHDRLFRYACRLRAKDMGKAEAVILLEAAAKRCKPPYEDESAAAIVGEAWKYPAGRSSFINRLAESSGPIVTADARSVRMEWPAHGVKATGKTLKEHSDGRITGHLSIDCTTPGIQRALRSAQFTFTALRTRKELAKDLAEKMPAPWEDLIEAFCAEVTRYVQEGEAICSLDLEEQPADPDPGFILYPVLAEGHPTVLFGSPGTGKSYLAQWWAMLTLAGGTPSEMPVQVHKPVRSILYLDWEGDEIAFRQRAHAIREGTPEWSGFPFRGLHYRRCTRPLAADVDQIRNQVEASEPELIVIDSLAPATGGDLNTSGPPNEFFTALRSLGGTALVLAHAAKGAAGTANASIFGSVFFTALARSVWQIRSDSQEGEDQVGVALFHSKVNYGRREKPFGLTIHHSEDSTWFTPGKIDDVVSAGTARSLKDRIYVAIKMMGKATIRDLAEELETNQNNVRAMLSYMAKQNLVTKLGTGKGQQWALIAREEER